MSSPVDFETWCRHYGYDPSAAEARADYDEYRRMIDLFSGLSCADDSRCDHQPKEKDCDHWSE